MCDFDSTSGAYHVTWTIDARKLDSNDKQAVSPSFEMSWKGAKSEEPKRGTTGSATVIRATARTGQGECSPF